MTRIPASEVREGDVITISGILTVTVSQVEHPHGAVVIRAPGSRTFSLAADDQVVLVRRSDEGWSR